jgi:hypothetical protein
MKNSEHLSCSVSFWICFQRCKNISSETHTYRDYNWRGETYWTSKNPGNLLLFVFQVSYQKRLISVNSKSCLKSANYRSTTLNPKICNPKPSKPVSASGGFLTQTKKSVHCQRRYKNMSSEIHTDRDYDWSKKRHILDLKKPWKPASIYFLGFLPEKGHLHKLESCLKFANYRSTILNPGNLFPRQKKNSERCHIPFLFRYTSKKM